MGEKTQQVAGNGTAARPAGNQVRARKDQQQRAGGADDDTGEVSFCARYSVHGMPQELREDAFFRKEDGRWFYVDGNVHAKQPVRREEPKVGRNDPCPCGSGKKYKKCCMPR